MGNSDRMKALIPLINDDDRKIVVLSAMAGTTNSLVEITQLLYANNIEEASVKNNNMRSKYHQVVDELFATDNLKKSGHELIDSHFDFIRNFTLMVFTKLQEKAILAQGELISTSLFHLLLQERNINSILLPALSFMRIDKDGEPDAFYIEENIDRELKNCLSDNIIITQGFICRNAYGEIDNLRHAPASHGLLDKEILYTLEYFDFHRFPCGTASRTSNILSISRITRPVRSLRNKGRRARVRWS